jgi:hypothetical protein
VTLDRIILSTEYKQILELYLPAIIERNIHFAGQLSFSGCKHDPYSMTFPMKEPKLSTWRKVDAGHCVTFKIFQLIYVSPSLIYSTNIYQVCILCQALVGP